jgi:hypothetical protein
MKKSLLDHLNAVDSQYEEYVAKGLIHIWRSRMQAIRQAIREGKNESRF